MLRYRGFMAYHLGETLGDNEGWALILIGSTIGMSGYSIRGAEMPIP